MADATKMRPMFQTQDRLEQDAAVIGNLVARLGGEVRLRFSDLCKPFNFTVWHDEQTDEMVILAKEPT